jgi:hypothetical protein
MAVNCSFETERLIVADWSRLLTGHAASIIGGVGDRNTASARVLHKNGFVPNPSDSEGPANGVEYTLTFSA